MTSAKATAAARWQLVEALAQDSTLSSIDVRLGLILISKYYNAEHGCAWPSRELLIDDLGVSRASITRSIDRLVQRGYFAVQRNKGRGRNNRYYPRFVAEAIQPEARDADQRRAAARQPRQRPRSPKQAPPAAYKSRIPDEVVAARDAARAKEAAEAEREVRARERQETVWIDGVPFDGPDYGPDPEREEAGRLRAERWQEDPAVIAMERDRADKRANGRDVGDADQAHDKPSPVDPEKGSPTRPFSGIEKGSPVHIKGLMGERKRAHRCGKIPLKIPPKKHLRPLAALTALASSRFSPDSGQQESPRATPEPMPATPASAPNVGVAAYNDKDGDVASTEPVSAEPVQRHLRVFADVLARARKPVKDASWWRERERQTEAQACETRESMTAFWLSALAEVAA